MTSHWQSKIKEEFLYPEALLRLLPYMSKAFAEQKKNVESKHDPITATVIIFLTSPLQLGLTEVGAMLFQGHSSLVYPFNLMTDRQKDYVRSCLDHRSEWNIYNNAVVFKRAQGDAPSVLCPSVVLLSLCRKLIDDQPQQSLKQRLAICNIILQRVQGHVQIDKAVQKNLNEWLATREAI